MSDWALRTTAVFDREFARLDKDVRRRIARALDEILTLEDPRARGKALTGQWRTYWRYRIGDHRVIVDIRDQELCLVALSAGHRSWVYE